MAGNWTNLHLAYETLKVLNRPLNAIEIWKEAKILGFDKNTRTKSDTPWISIRASLFTDIKNNPFETLFIRIEDEDEKFFLKGYPVPDQWNKPTPETKNKTENRRNRLSFEEKNLHPLLSSFVYGNDHFECMTKTIQSTGGEKGKGGFNRWQYPDIVGFRIPEKMEDLTWLIHDALNANIVKIYSFELKRELNYGNLRSHYFQAVSNSSWAHEGYLVAPIINNEPKFKEELKNLANAFGIGIIKLNLESIHDSSILYPARFKKQLDWNMIDKLVRINSNFNEFIINIKNTLESRKYEGKYDKIMNEDELLQHMSTYFKNNMVA